MTLADDAVELRAVGGTPEGCTVFGIFARRTGTEVGQIILRLDPSDPALIAFAGNIGFEVVPAHRGHRYALRACRLLGSFARRRGVSALWLMASPENIGSLRTIELLGATYVDTVMIPADSDMRLLGIDRVRRHRWALPSEGA